MNQHQAGIFPGLVFVVEMACLEIAAGDAQS